MKYMIQDNQAGFVLKNGIFQKMITAGTYHFSKIAGYRVEIEEMTGEVDYMDVPYPVLSRDPAFLEATVHMEIPDGSIGFLYINGKLSSYANRKEYTFWNVFDKHEIRIVPMTETVTGPEVSRQMLSLVPGKLYTEVKVGEGEIVGNYKLDEILEAKERISAEIYEALKDREGMFCVHFLTAGIKDIILPGEIRAIMNSVLVAEKTAQANVISRREEVASTRSLLNTAKLMEENQTLYKLKELEYLERICGKVGEISVNGNAGIVEQLGRLMGAERAV